MPIYEYQCERCAHQFETMQKLSEPVLTDCPECGESALRKLVSRVTFRLKGSGWYETDFKSDNKRNVADSANSEPSTSDSASDGSTKDSSKSESSSSDDSAASSSEKSDKKSESKKKGNNDKAA